MTSTFFQGPVHEFDTRPGISLSENLGLPIFALFNPEAAEGRIEGNSTGET